MHQILVEFVKFSAYLCFIVAFITYFKDADKKLKLCLIFWLSLLGIFQLTYYQLDLSNKFLNVIHISCYAFLAPVLMTFNSYLNGHELNNHWYIRCFMPATLIALLSVLMTSLPIEAYQAYAHNLIVIERVLFFIYCLFITYHNKLLLQHYKRISLSLKVWQTSLLFGTFIVLPLSLVSVMIANQDTYIYSNFIIAITIIVCAIYRVRYANLFLNINESFKEEQINIQCLGPKLTNMEGERIDMLLKNVKTYTNSKLTIEDIAKTVGSPTTYKINNYIKERYDTTFKQHIINLRIEHAADILRTSNRGKLEVIAEASGFSSYASFNQCFKRIYNNTPKQYRNQYHVNDNLIMPS